MFLIDTELATSRQEEYRAQAQNYQRGNLWARARKQERRAQRLAGRAQRLAERAGELETRAYALLKTASGGDAL